MRKLKDNKVYMVDTNNINPAHEIESLNQIALALFSCNTTSNEPPTLCSYSESEIHVHLQI